MEHFTLHSLPHTNAAMEVILHSSAYEMVRHDKRPCVILFPGGAYRFTADREAEPVALSFLQAGFQVCILRYSTRPDDSLPVLGDTPMQEGAAAIRCVRENALNWSIDPAKVIVCGFSAGGHAAASTGVFWKSPHIPGGEDGLGRPNAMLLCYSVLTGGEFGHRESFCNLTGCPGFCAENDAFSLEKYVRPDTPPAFLWHTLEDSAVPAENALLLAQALKQNLVPFELHLYTHGPHGISLGTSEVGPTFPRTSGWFQLAVGWLREMGLGPEE